MYARARLLIYGKPTVTEPERIIGTEYRTDVNRLTKRVYSKGVRNPFVLQWVEGASFRLLGIRMCPNMLGLVL
jgi:hypothetical protein